MIPQLIELVGQFFADLGGLLGVSAYLVVYGLGIASGILVYPWWRSGFRIRRRSRRRGWR